MGDTITWGGGPGLYKKANWAQVHEQARFRSHVGLISLVYPLFVMGFLILKWKCSALLLFYP